jgi:flagellar biosynthesis protein FlhB
MAPYPPQDWWHRKVVKEADHDILKMGERIGNIIAMFFIVFVVLIFINIQVQGYGFFTTKFGPVEQLVFYGSLLFGGIPSFIRAATGRRNLGRLVDLVGSVLFIVAAIYLLAVFPFDFTHLLDFLPSSVRPEFSWFNNDLFRLLFELAIVISVISLVYNAILYLSVRRELRTRRSAPAGP